MADYTLDQLRSLWDENSKAGNFASSGWTETPVPEGNGGGGSSYQSTGSDPNVVYLPNDDPKRGSPMLRREEGGGYSLVTQGANGEEHVKYSPEGKVIDRQLYENATPSHQNFIKHFLPIVLGGAALSVAGAGAGAGLADYAAANTAITAPEAAGIASLGGAGGSGLTAAEMAALNSAAASEVASGASLGAAGSGASAVGAGGTVLPGTAAGAAGGSTLGDAAGKALAGKLTDPKLWASLAAGLGTAALTKRSNEKIAQKGFTGGIDPNRLAFNRDTGEYTVRATGQKYAAGGGIAGLAPNEYKAGGRYLSGPGDGMSDNIKANIDGHQEARLADGEFVIPADVVSHIGNGSSNAGAKKLHDMMNRIRHARTGNPKQGKQIKPEKYLPA